MDYSYVDMNAVKAHGSTKEFKAFQKAMQDEGLTTGPLELKFVKPIGGFASRL
jgi:quinol monooxygenase YgiN